MGKLYFVRHGQTVWNVENKICGQTDSPLTEIGHRQAELAGENIRNAGIRADEILYSPLSRAKDTALHIAAATGIPAREEPALTEQNFGHWEGTPRDGADFLAAKREFCCRNGGGESMLQLAQRIYNLLDRLRAESGEKTYILVAHNGIARMVHSYFYDLTNAQYAAFGVGNSTVTEYDFDKVPEAFHI